LLLGADQRLAFVLEEVEAHVGAREVERGRLARLPSPHGAGGLGDQLVAPPGASSVGAGRPRYRGWRNARAEAIVANAAADSNPGPGSGTT